MKEPRVFIERAWVETIIQPLLERSKDDFVFFFICCAGYALRMSGHEEKMTGFADPYLQSLWEQTKVHRWDSRSGKAGYIGLKKQRDNGNE